MTAWASGNSAPLGDGRYTVVLDIRQNQGYGRVTCSYDPKKGADLPPPTPPATPEAKPAEKPATPAATPAPATAPGPQSGK